MQKYAENIKLIFKTFIVRLFLMILCASPTTGKASIRKNSSVQCTKNTTRLVPSSIFATTFLCKNIYSNAFCDYRLNQGKGNVLKRKNLPHKKALQTCRWHFSEQLFHNI